MFEEKVSQLNRITNPVMAKTSYSITEIQQILGLSKPTAYKLIKQNLFETVKIGRSIRVIKCGFDKWLNENEKEMV